MTDSAFSNIKLITFDCYGTLIDWEKGLQNSLRSLPGTAKYPMADLVQGYVQTEAALEQQTYLPYTAIQRNALRSLAERFRFPVPPEHQDVLSRDIGHWPPFADTTESLKRLKTKYMLGILSNIDIDLFAATNKLLGVEFDLIITAEDVRSYKPSHAHFLQAIEQTRLPKDEVLHVAQSLFHDAAPAAELGFKFAWINRYHQTRPNDVAMLGEFPNLKALADALVLPTGQ